MLLTVAERIHARGAHPFLHVALENTGAMRLYQAIGFEGRAELTIDVVHPA
jgi:predicted GNAT family acetyltransferase